MVFEIKNKVALVTGGASGMGLEMTKYLLQHGAKGVTIADVNIEKGEKVIKELQNEFGQNRVVFVLTDTSNCTSFEKAFKVTADHFKNVDILINNAGICRDNMWERQVDINVKGTINGMILGLEKYLKNYKQGDEAVIVNTASIAAICFYPNMPIYCATKAAILSLTKCWGERFHYERTKVRILAICPGLTETPLIENVGKQALLPEYIKNFEDMVAELESKSQSPSFVAKETVKLVERAPNSSVWVIEESKPAYQYISPDKNSFEKNILQ